MLRTCEDALPDRQVRLTHQTWDKRSSGEKILRSFTIGLAILTLVFCVLVAFALTTVAS